MNPQKNIFKTSLSGLTILLNVSLIGLFFYALINISENPIVILILDSFILLWLFVVKSNRLIIRSDQLIIQRIRQFPFLFTTNNTFPYNEIESIEIKKGSSGNPFFFLFGLYSSKENPQIIIKEKNGKNLTFELDCGYDNLTKAVDKYNKITRHH